MNLNFRDKQDGAQEQVSSAGILGLRKRMQGDTNLKVDAKAALTLKPKRRAKVRRKRSKKSLKLLGFAALAIALGGAGVGYLAVAASASSLKAEIELAKKVGCFVSVDDVNAVLNIPPEHNGERAYAGAESLLRAATRAAQGRLKPLSVKSPKFVKEVLDGTATVPDLELARLTLANEREALAAYRFASRFPRLAFHRDYSIAALTTLPEYSSMRTAASHLNMQAALDIRDGNWSKARENLLAAARMSQQLREDVTFIGGLTQAQLQIEAYRTSREILANYWHDPRATALVKDVLSATPGTVSIARLLRIETLMAVQLPEIAQRRAGGDKRFSGSDGDSMFGLTGPMMVPGIGNAVVTNAIRVDRQQVEAALAYGDDYVGLKAAFQEIERKQHLAGILAQYSDAFTTVFTGSTDVIADVPAYQKLLNQGLAAVDYRNRMGDWPTRPLLGDKAAIDPHTNRPLSFSGDAGRFQMWSSGRNGINERGKTGPDEFSNTQDDINLELKG